MNKSTTPQPLLPRSLDYAPVPPRRLRNRLITAGVLCGLVVAAALRLARSERTAAPLPVNARTAARASIDESQRRDHELIREQCWRTKIAPRLASADEACAASVDQSLRLMADFLDDRKSGARPLAESMLAFGSKWKLVVSRLPDWAGGDANAHRNLLERRFGEYVFTDEQIRRAVEAVVTAHVQQMEAIENQLLVEVRADLADLPVGAIPAADSDAAFSEMFARFVAEATPRVAESLGVDVARELGSWVAGEVAARVAIRVLTTVATRLGVSAGILTAGASASWASFGLTVLAAIVIDETVGRLINWATDPVGTLEARIKEMLDDTSDLVVNGRRGVHGLRAELVRLNETRRIVRTEALRRIVRAE